MSTHDGDPIYRWNRKVDAPIDFAALRSFVHFLDSELLMEYEPTHIARESPFLDRLRKWLDSAPTEEEQKILFEMLGYLYFIGRREFQVLYRFAANGPIHWWLVESTGKDLDDPALAAELAQAETSTWYCPITDSMQIAAFHHINRLEGKDFRPDWRTLAQFGDLKKVEAFMKGRNLDRLVLLEDFVGTGTQAAKAVELACRLPSHVRILVCPLVITQRGVAKLLATVGEDASRVRIAPVLTLPQECVLGPRSVDGEPERFPVFRDCLKALRHLVPGEPSADSKEIFGFRGTGALSIMYSNCPNNVPPVIHMETENWQPLFPRASRA